jgi:hypothetical protein
MGLEVATYIHQLVTTNPVGASDLKSQGDEHLRLIKSTLQATFAAIAGAVTASHTELNYVTGVTSAIQTQLNGKAATSHAHSAADLTSGTIPDARFPATLPAASGVNLTSLNASALASGTVADARLSANAALYNATAITVNWQPTTPDSSAGEVGYKGDPVNTQSGSYSCVLSDAGKCIYETGSGATVTVPVSVAFPVGTKISVVCDTATTVDFETDTLYSAGFSVNNTSISARTFHVFRKIAANLWVKSAGVT